MTGLHHRSLVCTESMASLRFRRGVRLKFAFYIVTILMAVTLLTFTFCGSLVQFEFVTKVTRRSTVKNYFLSQDSYDALEFIVNTTGCKILDLDPWDYSILEHIVKLTPTNICETAPRWTYVNGSSIYVNTTSITESGYDWANLRCCYKEIHRVEQSVTAYDANADTAVEYSSSCTPMGLVTDPKTDYVSVTCKNKLAYLFDEVLASSLYKNFHIVAVTNSPRVQSTIKRWKSIEEDISNERRQSSSQDQKGPTVVERPPNVLIIGMDSTSRLNLRRGMLKTKRVLDEIGAHEMLGYTKVGENTYPNTIPFLTGYDEYQMEDLCRYERQTKLDDCPFVWKNYKDAHYLTAEVEDSPRLTSFNYVKTGFVLQPTDFYSRPIMLAAHRAVPGYPYSIECVGYKTVDQFLQDYMLDLVDLAKLNNVPMFLMSWLTQLGHEGLNNIQTGDKYYADFLRSLLDKGHLNNSILIFMSDHGYRFGAIRSTLSGWYEDRLPTMWIRLPENIISRFPEWEDALTYNERQLSSPYDLYHTFVHILQSFSKFPGVQEAPMRNGSTLPRKYGQSFFTPLPENRTCSGAGIPDYYCACEYPIKVNSDDPVLHKAVAAAIQKVNDILPSQCVPFNLSKVEGAARLSTNELEKSTKPFKYVINYRTQPGEFLFEATVHHYVVPKEEQKEFEVSGIVQRLTKINTDVSCIHGDSTLELYCYCESELNKS